MKFLREETAVNPKEIDFPVFVMNYREVEIMLAVLSKADQYIPDIIMPDKSRIRKMKRELKKYIKQKELDARRMRMTIDGLDKVLVLTAHAMHRMEERKISLEVVKEALVKATVLDDDDRVKIYEYNNIKFIVNEDETTMILITLYKNEEIL